MKNFFIFISAVVLIWSNLYPGQKNACYYFMDELTCLNRVENSFSVENNDLEILIEEGAVNWYFKIEQKSPEISIVKKETTAEHDKNIIFLRRTALSKNIDLMPVVSVKNGEMMATTGEVGLVFKPGTSRAQRSSMITDYSLVLRREIKGIEDFGVYFIEDGRDPFNVSMEIYETGMVKWVQPVWLENPQLNSTPNDLYYADQWHHPVVNSEKGWSITKGRPDAKIAVIDSGVDTAHPDLRLAWGHSFVPTEQYVDPNMGAFQNQYIMAHGTCVSGIAAAVGFNEWGVAGICADCTVIPIKYIGLEQNYPPLDRKLHAMVWAVDEGAWVINNSWVVAPDKNRQTDTCIEVPSDNFLLEAVDYAVNNGRDGLGTIIVWAAGNSTCDTVMNKSLQDSRTVTVSGLDTDLSLVSYSNYGVAIDIAAPAGESLPGKSGLVTTDVSVPNKGFNPAYNNANPDYNDFPDQLYTRYFDGTSAAAPVVSGALALMLTARPGMTYQDAIDCMRSAAAQPSAICQHGEQESCFGAGILDVGKMVEMAHNGECGGYDQFFCLGDEDCSGEEKCDLESGECVRVEKEEDSSEEKDNPGQKEESGYDETSEDDENNSEDEIKEDENSNNVDAGGSDTSLEDESPGCSMLYLRR